MCGGQRKCCVFASILNTEGAVDIAQYVMRLSTDVSRETVQAIITFPSIRSAAVKIDIFYPNSNRVQLSYVMPLPSHRDLD